MYLVIQVVERSHRSFLDVNFSYHEIHWQKHRLEF